ncbi:MAG: transporter [Sphingomonas bacterium]|nr:transporter [Sphingomonas bacterium]
MAVNIGAGDENAVVIDEASGPVRRFLGIAALALGTALIGIMLTVVIPILPNIAAETAHGGGGRFPIQLLIAMPMLGLVIGGLLSTVLFARVSARTVFLGALLLFAAVGAFGAVADMRMLVISRLVIGMICACLGAASTALIGERVSRERRARVLGIQTAASSILAIGAMLLSGRVADAAGWRSSFLIFPAFAIVIFVIALFCSSPSPVRPKVTTLLAKGGNWPAVFKLWPIYLFVVAVNVTAFTTSSQASFVLADEGITSSIGRAQVMSLNQIMIVIAAISFPFVRGWVGSRFMPALILLVMGAGLVMLGANSGLTSAALALAVLGTGNGWLFPYQSSLLLQRAPGAVRGQAAGLMVSSQFLADAINPLMLAPIIAAVGLKTTIASVGVLALIGCACAVVFGIRYLREPEPAGEERLSHG